MSWLKLDDNYDTHPKIVSLDTDGQRWVWTRILLSAARHGVGSVPFSIGQTIPGATPKFLRKCCQLGLLDVDENGNMHVHDFHEYRQKDTTAAERKRRERAKQNGQTPPSVTQMSRVTHRDETVTRTQTRAPGPSPYPKELSSVVESVERLAADDDDKNDNEEEPVSPEVAALMPNLKEL